ncbi:MAG: terpene cyclase/mutase family protein [Planctomycetota bacterium]|nr:terpene cyclase/mutase family protein [Planctomycetota bacterium]
MNKRGHQHSGFYPGGAQAYSPIPNSSYPLLGLLLSLALIPPSTLSAQTTPVESILEDRAVKSCERGLAYLAEIQNTDGAIVKGQYPNVCTALSCMALMASGHFPGRGKFGKNLERGILWLAKQADAKGYFGNDGGRMYGHGMCTLALTEAYGMLSSRRDNMTVRDVLEKAVNVIVGSQTPSGHHQGGWRYNPTPGDSDLSVTAWQVQALRGAQNCQISIPRDTIARAIDYISRCYHRGAKGFGYQPGGGRTDPMRSAGVVLMHTLKEGERDIVKEAGESLLQRSFGSWGGGYYFYQNFYSATAGLMLGEAGENKINIPIEKTLIAHQREDGSWPRAPGGYGAGEAYYTAFSCLILAARFQYLPIYQE